ncbi:MAG: hypothetical protein M0Z87_06645 [Actinomycetota bacterium]|nr:hypothetical protein [Actinomycetota bacterium]
MTRYRVHDAGVAKAKKLIRDGAYDDCTEWSDAAPSAAQANDEVKRHGYEGFGEWHLAVDSDASERTKARYRFPYGDFSKVNRAALVHAKQRAVQNDHPEVAEAAQKLLELMDHERAG